jgi:hypothetical protein
MILSWERVEHKRRAGLARRLCFEEHQAYVFGRRGATRTVCSAR